MAAAVVTIVTITAIFLGGPQTLVPISAAVQPSWHQLQPLNLGYSRSDQGRLQEARSDHGQPTGRRTQTDRNHRSWLFGKSSRREQTRSGHIKSVLDERTLECGFSFMKSSLGSSQSICASIASAQCGLALPREKSPTTPVTLIFQTGFF